MINSESPFYEQKLIFPLPCKQVAQHFYYQLSGIAFTVRLDHETLSCTINVLLKKRNCLKQRIHVVLKPISLVPSPRLHQCLMSVCRDIRIVHSYFKYIGLSFTMYLGVYVIYQTIRKRRLCHESVTRINSPYQSVQECLCKPEYRRHNKLTKCSV